MAEQRSWSTGSTPSVSQTTDRTRPKHFTASARRRPRKWQIGGVVLVVAIVAAVLAILFGSSNGAPGGTPASPALASLQTAAEAANVHASDFPAGDGFFTVMLSSLPHLNLSNTLALPAGSPSTAVGVKATPEGGEAVLSVVTGSSCVYAVVHTKGNGFVKTPLGTTYAKVPGACRPFGALPGQTNSPLARSFSSALPS